MIFGIIAGKITFRKELQRESCRFAATWKYIGWMPAVAVMVVISSGKKLVRKIMKIAGKSPIPNQRIANGAQASGDMGLRNWIKGLISRLIVWQHPSSIPKGTAMSTAR
jgi:hypothetical protein